MLDVDGNCTRCGKWGGNCGCSTDEGQTMEEFKRDYADGDWQEALYD